MAAVPTASTQRRCVLLRLLFSKGVGFVAKPRCGSTLVRRTLDRFLKLGDISIDVGSGPLWHPHLPAAQIRNHFLTKSDQPSVRLFTVTRNPIDMLLSYWKFFKPDYRSRYSFQPGYEQNSRIDFDRWVVEGRLPVSSLWLEDAPVSTSRHNLTPLGLEFRVMDRKGENLVHKIFQLEEIEKADDWLSFMFGATVCLAKSPPINASLKERGPKIGDIARDRVRLLFPTEARMYNI